MNHDLGTSLFTDYLNVKYCACQNTIPWRYSGKRLKASTMYGRIKKNRPPENSFLFHQNVRIEKPVSLHHLLQIWPEMVLQVHSSINMFFTGLPAHNIDYSMP
jgi:hypothetical protein